MPIIEGNPRHAFEKFEVHMEAMVRSVLPMPAPTVLTLRWKDESGVLQFTKASIPTSVPVDTTLGELHLSIAQNLRAIREGPKYRLRTQRYAYKLLPSDDPGAEALIRWEFDADTDDHAQCRNHLHLNASLPVGHGTLHLSRAHVPTAWVLVEHVLRFLFHDLQVAPRTADWPTILRESETQFYEQFTSKRYRFGK